MLRRIAGINSDDYCPKLLPNQLRHSKLSDTLWVSQLRSELRHCRPHSVGQSDKFQQSQAEWKQILERSNTQGVQLRHLCEETRTAPVLHKNLLLQCEIKELQGQLQNLHRKNTRTNTLTNQIQIANNSMKTRNQKLAQQLQTSNLQLRRYRLKFLSCELRWRGINLPKIERQNIFKISGKKNTSLVRENIRQSAEFERFILSLQEAEIETARLQSPWEDAQNTFNSWSYAAEELYPTAVGSGDSYLLIAAHTAGDTSQCTPRNFSVATAVSSSALGFSLPMAGWETPCKEEHKVTLEEKENHLRSPQPGKTLRKTISTKVRPQKDYQLQENFGRSQQPENTLCKVINRTVESLKRRKQKGLSLRNSRNQ